MRTPQFLMHVTQEIYARRFRKYLKDLKVTWTMTCSSGRFA